MIITELYKGQGLGNQLACYIATRVIAKDKGYDFGIMHPENFKGNDFLNIDFGKKVIGGKGPEGGPPEKLPEGIKYYYSERKTTHPDNGADIRLYDKDLINILDNTKIDGLMQDEQYITHRKDEIREWLKVKEEFECYDYSDENTCVINFRGGEYTRVKDFFLDENYWKIAVKKMLSINKNFRFIVITDDVFTAKKFFPNYGVFHFSIAKDYVIIKNAKYLILSNSSFAWFPAWLNKGLKYCIAPKYWGRYNISDGYWSLGYNITKDWNYLDKKGEISNYDACSKEYKIYLENNKHLYNKKIIYKNKMQPKNLKSKLVHYTPLKIKNIIKSLINIWKNITVYIRLPLDIITEKKRMGSWLSKIQISEYRKKIKIYDIFNFFNELELLEIRLNILDSYVDYFVIVESTLTHSGHPKDLFYNNNKHLFKKFEHKIIHHIITNSPKDFDDVRERLQNPGTPEIEKQILREALSSDNIRSPGENNFLRDFYEKESVKIPLIGLSDNDFCFVSDLDEIWNPELIIDYSKDDIYKPKQDGYIYFLNNRTSEIEGWTGTIATKYKNIRDNCLNHLRTRGKVKHTILKNGGWHFSFQGGVERVKTKIESYSHQEINNDQIKSKINEKLLKNKDIRGRYIKFWKDESRLPKYILDNKEKYKNFFS